MVAGLRRFGCMVCRWIARDLSELRGLLDQHGVRLVGVGPETLGLQEFLDGGYFSGGAIQPSAHPKSGLMCWQCPPSPHVVPHRVLGQWQSSTSPGYQPCGGGGGGHWTGRGGQDGRGQADGSRTWVGPGHTPVGSFSRALPG